MKTKIKTAKLTLSRQTLRRLGTADLQRVAGGSNPTTTGTSGITECVDSGCDTARVR